MPVTASTSACLTCSRPQRSVDRPERRPATVVLDHRPRIPPVHLQPLPHHRLVVVASGVTSSPPHFSQRATFARLGPERRHVGATHLADPSAPDAPHQFLVRHLHLDHDQRIAIGDDAVEGLRLRHRAREAVEHEPGFDVRPAQPLPDDAGDRARRSPARRDPSRPSPARPSSLPLCTASRRMSPVEIFGMPVLPGEPLGLRSLAGARRPQHHHVQRHGLTRDARESASSS